MKLKSLTINTVYIPKKQHEIQKSCQQNGQQQQFNDTITTDETVDTKNSMINKNIMITSIILRLSSL